MNLNQAFHLVMDGSRKSDRDRCVFFSLLAWLFGSIKQFLSLPLNEFYELYELNGLAVVFS